MLLNVWLDALPLILWVAVVLWNVTVPVPGVKVPPLLVQSPERLMPFAPAESVPEANVRLPATVRVLPKLKVALVPCVSLIDRLK